MALYIILLSSNSLLKRVCVGYLTLWMHFDNNFPCLEALKNLFQSCQCQHQIESNGPNSLLNITDHSLRANFSLSHKVRNKDKYLLLNNQLLLYALLALHKRVQLDHQGHQALGVSSQSQDLSLCYALLMILKIKAIDHQKRVKGSK